MGENTDHLRSLEEEEEALSLCDLSLDNEDEKGVENAVKHARLSSETTEFFSFLSDLSIDMCPADDIIFSGKLVPLKGQHVPVLPEKIINNSSKDDKRPLLRVRKRSESLSDLQSTVMSRSDSMKSTGVLRYSRSLDYKKLCRMWSSKSSLPDPSMERNSSGRGLGKSDAKKALKPPWYLLMFGMVKFPPEMELKDIRNRQFRRSPSVMFPPMDDSNKVLPNRSSGKTAWRFLEALSCKDPTSIEATASFCMPNA